VTASAGEPVEFALAAGSEAEVAIFKELESDLPEGSIICADKAYTDYDYEDHLEEVGLHAKAQGKRRTPRGRRRRGRSFWVSRFASIQRDRRFLADSVELLFQEVPRGDAARVRA
jgi:hypothetical protein